MISPIITCLGTSRMIITGSLLEITYAKMLKYWLQRMWLIICFLLLFFLFARIFFASLYSTLYPILFNIELVCKGGEVKGGVYLHNKCKFITDFTMKFIEKIRKFCLRFSWKFLICFTKNIFEINSRIF